MSTKQITKNISINNFFFIILGGLVLSLFLTGYFIVLLLQNQQEYSKKYDNRYRSLILADELRQSSDDLTRFARTFVVSKDKIYEKYYWDVLKIRNGEINRPTRYESIYWDFVVANGKKPRKDSNQKISLQKLMEQQGFTQNEFEKLKTAQKNSDDLIETETIAMNATNALLNLTGNEEEEKKQVFNKNMKMPYKLCMIKNIIKIKQK